MTNSGRNILIAGAMALSALSISLPFSTPASAQNFSDSYKFLEAVRDANGTEVTEFLNQPGTNIVNTRDQVSLETALHIVTARRDATWIRFLTAKGARPNVRNKKGETPLMIASNLGFVDGVAELLKAGADIDESNVAGETPLISAVHRRDTSMMRLLLTNGANPERNDNSGRSARDYAALHANPTVLAELARHDKSKEGEPEKPSYGPSF
ncbi:ankyrin repeat domain-containing protein [Altererythrobacter sp. ZODW24]|uniref:ankyrin repeat domain-containing protein n=1 Tax=Altererythrobacter sp. ZODW24 TaxID=2185142 RepID=UPI001F080C36|nr:ankyrin repeat domain-containing protein [Altererythrobacter sp. ZODW24]